MPKVAWAAGRILEIRRREGLSGLFFRALAVAGYRRDGWFVRPLGDAVRPVDGTENVELSELTAADVDDYLAFRRGATRGGFLERLEKGWRCHAARCAGCLASVTWTSTGSGYIEFLDHTFPLEADEVYLFDSFTVPGHRGQRIQALICARIMKEFHDLGYRAAITLIAPENRPNIASRSRSGFRRTGIMGRIRIGGWTRHFFRGNRRIDSANSPST
ncbi:MAG: hypothetical protein ACREK3_07960 [Gemmatimonadota bacterium]